MIQEILARFIRTLVPFLAIWGISTQSMAAPIVLPPGQACLDFGITIDVNVPEHRVMRTFYDKNGNPVRYLAAGKGNQLVFTNSASGVTLTVKTGGSVEHITPNPNGTETWVTSGHELVVLFPTDGHAPWTRNHVVHRTLGVYVRSFQLHFPGHPEFHREVH